MSTIWNAAAAAVYGFALCVALAMAGGGLDPVGLSYYAVAASWKVPVLLTLLAALQVLWIGDAIVLGRRLKSTTTWIVLIVAAMVGPFIFVVLLGQIDAWRYDHRSTLTNLGVGAVMVVLVTAAYGLRRVAFRRWA